MRYSNASIGRPRHRSSRSGMAPRLLAVLVHAAAFACMHALPAIGSEAPAAAGISTSRPRRPGQGAGASNATSASSQSGTAIVGHLGDQLAQGLRSADAGSSAAWSHMHGDRARDAELFDVVGPFVVEDAEVQGPACEEDQAAFQAEYDEGEGDGDMHEMRGWGGEAEGSAGGSRSLLHGKRKPSKYVKCSRCTIIRCVGRGSCTGHCKKNGRLFDCTGKGDVRTCQRGGTPWQTAPETLPADRLEPLSAVIVTANVPYIGCANITGLPTGCPGPDTPGGTSGRFSLVGSTCVTRFHHLDECESPYFPFGYCMCQYEFQLSRGRTRLRDIPCSSVGMQLDLELARAPVEGGEGGPGPLLSDLRVTLEREGASTITTFHDYAEEENGPTYSYNNTFELNRRPDVNVRLDYYRTWYSQGINFTTSGVVLPEYEDDPDRAAYEELVEDYYFFSTPRYFASDPIAQCIYSCRLAGGQVIGTVDADYYSVVYSGNPSCEHCYDGTYDDTATGVFSESKYDVIAM